jgi:hypothetical protein
MRDWICGRLYSICLRKKIYEQTFLSPSNIEKYNVYLKRYVQPCVIEIIRLYTSMKEFRLAKGVKESSEHINKKIEHMSCFRLKSWKAKRKRLYSIRLLAILYFIVNVVVFHMLC